MSDINKVLIADDDTFMLLSLKTVLEKEGFSVIEAKDGQQAVTAFIEHHPDCVLLDGLMPNMDGFTACNEIRLHPTGKALPILIISGLSRAEIKEKHPDIKATGYIPKPIDWLKLIQKIKKL